MSKPVNRRGAWGILSWAVLGLVIVSACWRVIAAPPLKVDKSAPLLLEDPPTTRPAMAATPKLICYDCHATFREESLAVRHAAVNVTCVTCHGESRAHADDEDNTTPPQIMFGRADIEARCQECHKKHNAPAAQVVARWQQRKLHRMEPGELACTDCHGWHRMNVRTIHWDPKTGKLLDARKPGK